MSRLIPRKRGLAALALAMTLSLALVGVASGELVSSGNVQISFHGSIAPVKLPRKDLYPVGVTMGAKIKTANGETPPRLSKIILDINSHGVIEEKGLAQCPLNSLNNSSGQRAKQVCGDAEVGHGSVTSNVQLPGQGKFASHGSMLAFNGRYKGKPAIFAHVTSTGTLSITYVIIFIVTKTKGTYGTSMVATVPSIASGSGYITAFNLSLRRDYTVGGKSKHYVSASCPLPAGINIASFPFARSTYIFDDGTKIASVLKRDCKARG